ncbi:MAG TPA: DUF1015 domain-containing protein [Actinomycetota bacterium]|nr:DUF1015 domain-containing protein [Actinomycetota bacterium]
MPIVRAFHGIRYASSEDMPNLICPPYDIITPAMQEDLHQRHPHNAVRLELAAGVGASDLEERYSGAARAWATWISEGILVRDEEPSLYVYRQDFTGPSGDRRRVVGIVGALELEPFGSTSGVLPHERTMPGPKADRLALLTALPVNISPIYAIYRGAGALVPYLEALEHRPTTARVAEDGVLHRLWVVSATAEIEMLIDALEAGPLVIADGHHRYETALTFHESALGDGREGDHGSIMCLCVDADSEGLVVLPYNRAVSTAAIPPRGDLATTLARFEVRELEPDEADGALRSSDSDHPFVLVEEGRELLVEIDDATVVGAVGDRAVAWRALDVVALHEVLLPELGLHDAELRFTKDPADVRALARTGSWLGVLLRPLAAPQVVDVARSGERMPQKASYFWPKAATGMVFRPLLAETS